VETEVESGFDKMLFKNETKNFKFHWVITRILVPFLAIAFLDAASPPQEVAPRLPGTVGVILTFYRKGVTQPLD
jgi:hypothetical protein